MKTPFIKYVPTEICANLKWRAKVHRRVMDDPSYASTVWDACAADPLFYISGFGFTYDPRPGTFGRRPFILWPIQHWGLREILDSIGKYDLLIDKSRDMGASWMCVLAYEWRWHFHREQSFLLGSRDATYVDNAANPKSLFWKIDFFHRSLPPWLMPHGFKYSEHRRKMHLTNPENDSVIDGETTTKNFARGDRRTGVMCDEFAADPDGHAVLASTQDVTESRLFNSTPQGINTAHETLHQTDIKILRFHWRDHPEKRKGLYCTAKDGTLDVLDKEHYPKDYEPILDGRLRSIRYDIKWKKSTPRIMAQEWDIDAQGSGAQFFLPVSIREAIDKFARPPVLVGDLEYDSTTAEPIEFRESPRGRIKLWGLLDKNGNLPRDHKYDLGCDVSAGTGASNSVGCGYDMTTNEKVLEYVNPYIRPEEFAKQAVAIARWLCFEQRNWADVLRMGLGSGLTGAFLLWESNGPGRQFGSRVMELQYGNVYFRKKEEAITKKVSKIPGWASTKEGKLTLIGDYRDAIEKGMIVNRSKEALEECLEYIFDPLGGVSHACENDKDDPSGAKANHGDRVIADALAYRGLSERATKSKKSNEPEIPIGSLAWRQQQREANKPKPGRELLSSEGWY